MLMRFDPFRDLENVTQMLTGRTTAARQMTMTMDAYREGDHFIVKLDLPGVDPESIDLTVEKNSLTIRAERTWEPSEGQEVLIAERPHGRFVRQLFLGEGLDVDNIHADYEHGVLTLTIPVAEQAKPRKVEVSSSGDGASRSIPAEATS